MLPAAMGVVYLLMLLSDLW